MELVLCTGESLLIDDEDYELISQYTWNAFPCKRTTYARTNSSRKLGKRHTVLLHRLIMNAPEGYEVDHINGNGLDNRKENLRVCTKSGNMRNKQANISHKSSKYKGVSLHRQANKWRVRLSCNGTYIHVGLFSNEEEAAKAYDKVALEYFGEFAKTNF
jgi:hypothetical protein